MAFNLLLAVMIGALVFVLFLEQPPVIYNNVPFEVLKKQIKAGETVPLRVDFCVMGNLPIVYSVARTLHNKDTNQYTILTNELVMVHPGCRVITSYITSIPPQVASGTYHIIGITSVSKHGRSFHIPWESQTFEVVK